MFNVFLVLHSTCFCISQEDNEEGMITTRITTRDIRCLCFAKQNCQDSKFFPQILPFPGRELGQWLTLLSSLGCLLLKPCGINFFRYVTTKLCCFAATSHFVAPSWDVLLLQWCDPFISTGSDLPTFVTDCVSLTKTKERFISTCDRIMLGLPIMEIEVLDFLNNISNVTAFIFINCFSVSHTSCF